MLVDGDVVDVRNHHTRSDSGRVHQVARVRVRHEHSLTGWGVAHRHAKEGASARIDDDCIVALVFVLGIAKHGLTTERARALVAHNPLVHARLAHGVSTRFHAIECLFKTDGALLCIHLFSCLVPL